MPDRLQGSVSAFLKLCAWAYTLIVALAIVWAWYVDLSMRNSNQEHMLPDVILLILTLPLSKVGDSLFLSDSSGLMIQLVSETFTATLQVGLVWLIVLGVSRYVRRGHG